MQSLFGLNETTCEHTINQQCFVNPHHFTFVQCFQTVLLEKTLESPLDCKEIKPVNPKGNQSWIFFGRTDAETETPILWPPDCKELTRWERPWCWERLKARGEGDNRGWDGWMASLTQTWVWVSSRCWWQTGKLGMLQSVGSQRVRHDWVTELNWRTRQGRRRLSGSRMMWVFTRPS